MYPIKEEVIISVSKARAKIGQMVQEVNDSGDLKYVISNGSKLAVLVDLNYIKKLEKMLKTFVGDFGTRKSFINPKDEKFYREFSDEEIATWLEEDKL